MWKVNDVSHINRMWVPNSCESENKFYSKITLLCRNVETIRRYLPFRQRGRGSKGRKWEGIAKIRWHDKYGKGQQAFTSNYTNCFLGKLKNYNTKCIHAAVKIKFPRLFGFQFCHGTNTWYITWFHQIKMHNIRYILKSNTRSQECGELYEIFLFGTYIYNIAWGALFLMPISGYWIMNMLLCATHCLNCIL